MRRLESASTIAVPRRDRALHLRPARAELAGNGAARQPPGDARHVIALVGVVASTQGVGWQAIIVGIVVGAAVGVYRRAQVKMTAMPQMVAIFNGAGGGAAALDRDGANYSIATQRRQHGRRRSPITLVLSAIIGAISFSGSIVAFLKLQELMTGRPVTYPGQQVVNALVLSCDCSAWRSGSSQRSARLPLWAFASLLAAASRCSASCSCCRSAARTCRS